MINESSHTEHADHPVAERVEGPLLLAAAERIVPQTGNRRVLAERFLAGSASAGLDLSHAFAVIDRSGGTSRAWARQACLAIPGPGRTAMLFVSSPVSSSPESPADESERDACVCTTLASLTRPEIVLAQALPDAAEPWGSESFARSGMRSAGDLAYLSCSLHVRKTKTERFPEGLVLRPVGDVTRPGAERELLKDTLERSYEGTLDCPELCGLRDVEDILTSHLAAGVFDPKHWLILIENGRGIGCSLVSETEDGTTAELVYIGLTPEARQRGLGRRLLRASMLGLSGTRAQRLVCAVDRRNAPAVRLYESEGFIEFSARRAWVLPV